MEHPFPKQSKTLESFSDYEVFSLQIGEESGRLVKVLNQLSDLLYSKY